MTWDDATITQLRDLWAQGHSTAEIGRRLDCSKNAICGKAHRLGLDARPSPIAGSPTGPANVWNAETIAKLAYLRARGLTGSEIAAELDCAPVTVNLRIRNTVTPRAGTHTLPPPASLALPVPASTGAVVAFRPSVPASNVPKPPTTPPSPRTAVAPRTLAQQEFHRGATMFRKRDPRAPAAIYPTADEIARFIAQRGVTKCPTAAAAFTAGTITAAETAAIAAHDDARQEAWKTGKGAGMLKAAMAGAAARRRAA